MLKRIIRSAVPSLENAVVRLLPTATTAAAAAFSVQPVHLPGYESLTPAYTLMAVYHWTAYRPDLLPPLAIFLIGVGFDLFAGGPLGVTPLLLLLARGLVLHHRRLLMDKNFSRVWGGFSLLAAAAMLWQWALHCLLAMGLVECCSSIFQTVLTISLFPLASFSLGRIQRALISAD